MNKKDVNGFAGLFDTFLVVEKLLGEVKEVKQKPKSKRKVKA